MPLVDGLPAFLRFDPPRPTVQIIDDGEKFYPEGHPDRRFEWPSEVYYYIEKELGVEALFPEGGFKRHESHPETGDGGVNGMFFEETNPASKHKSSAPLLLNYDPDLHRRVVLGAYEFFQETVVKFAANPNDFLTCYHFLNNHPLFYSYREVGNGISWDTNGFSSGENPLSVYGDETSGPRFLLEPTYYPDHHDDGRARTIDFNITASADSYEAVVIKTAAQANRYYDETGEAREGVEDTEFTRELMAKLDASTSAMNETDETNE